MATDILSRGNTELGSSRVEPIIPASSSSAKLQAQARIANIALGWIRVKIVQPIRTSKYAQSRVCQITMLVLGVLLILIGLGLLFLFHSQLGVHALWLVVPAIVGLIKLLVTSLLFDEACSPQKLLLFQNWMAILEDQFDDGILNSSTRLFSSSSSNQEHKVDNQESKTGNQESKTGEESTIINKESILGSNVRT
ncbi:cysteine-rich outer membrane protein [Candidatus Chlamydia sanziniae]|uniref:Sulfur-rich protein n=1 Tax=Candidatus Chlamydia sanziniae TaxID=1806891 RepID=A0A1A9HVC1_9CHLA|nr:cysteine-rich outer membrane protein [Candidatus Chlamydia sanziniae]ANH78351.1 Sulfur-rich protein [Candidatus Chlamydia sanziniae]